MKAIDFYSDLKMVLHLEYATYGVRIPIKDDIRSMLFDYFTIHYKIIAPIKREVLLTSEIKNRLDSHPNSTELVNLINRLRTGEDVNIYQSSRLKESGYHDQMRNSWNIFHFHMDAQINYRKKKSNRSNELLFVYIDEKRAIILDTSKHIKGIFGNEKWLTMLDNNFPEVLKPFIVKDVTDYYPELNSIDRQTMWDKGYSVPLIRINNKIIIDPGVGRSTSGHSTDVSISVMSMMRWLHQISSEFREYHTEICQYLKCKPDDTQFKFVSGNRTFNIIIEHSGLPVITYPKTVDLEKISVNVDK